METMRPLLAWMWVLHLFGALWLATGVFSSAVVLAQVKRAGDAAERYFGLRLAWRLMSVFILPGVLVAGLLGFYLVTAFQFGFGYGWVRASILLYLLLLGAILFVQVPHFRKAAQAGPGAELDRLARAPLPAILTHVNALLIVVMILLMALKPF
jgi:uncharacterized membrane protein